MREGDMAQNGDKSGWVELPIPGLHLPYRLNEINQHERHTSNMASILSIAHGDAVYYHAVAVFAHVRPGSSVFGSGRFTRLPYQLSQNR